MDSENDESFQTNRSTHREACTIFFKTHKTSACETSWPCGPCSGKNIAIIFNSSSPIKLMRLAHDLDSILPT